MHYYSCCLCLLLLTLLLLFRCHVELLLGAFLPVVVGIIMVETIIIVFLCFGDVAVDEVVQFLFLLLLRQVLPAPEDVLLSVVRVDV